MNILSKIISFTVFIVKLVFIAFIAILSILFVAVIFILDRLFNTKVHKKNTTTRKALEINEYAIRTRSSSK